MPVALLENLNDAEKLKRLNQQFDAFKKIREPFESDYKDIATYMLPRYNNWSFNETERGKSSSEEIYDSTAQNAISLVSDGMQGYTAPQNEAWFRFGLPNEPLFREPVVRAFVQDTEQAMYSELPRSPFHHTLSEAMPVAIGMGITTVYQEPDPETRSVIYRHLHPKQVYINANGKGLVDEHIVRYPIYLHELVRDYEDKLPKQLLEEAERNPYSERIIRHYVMPRQVRMIDGAGALNMPFASYKVMEGGSSSAGGAGVLLEESGYLEDPYTTLRFTNNSDEVYARGWGHMILPDTLRLNEGERTLLLAAHLSVRPPASIPAELEGKLDLEPEGVSLYLDPTRDVKLHNMVGNYPIALDYMQDLRNQVRQKLMVEFFLALQPFREGQPPTATQVLEMQGEKAALLGTTQDRIHSNLITPMMIKHWRMASRDGRMPEVPEILLDAGVPGLRIEFVGPLAQIQKRFYAFQGIRQTLAQLLPLADVPGWEQVTDRVDIDQVAMHIMESGNFPQRAMRGDEAVARMRQARNEAAAQQQQTANTIELAKVADKLPALNQVAQGQAGVPA